MELHLGGLLDVDYRNYLEDARADNRFDVRRARIIFNGQLTQWFRFFSQFEFQDNVTDNLLDAYAEAVMGRHALRFGQFKEPFSLQWQTADKAIFFTERAMCQSLAPNRSVGLMLHGSFGPDIFQYSGGVFNADGDDGTARGNQSDEPEGVARFVVAPFKPTSISWLRNLQFGTSFSYADIELANLEFKVKSAGMNGTPYSIYALSHDTKFGVLQDVGTRQRFGLEAAWAWKSIALQGELIKLKFTDLEPAGRAPADADFSSWYASAAVCLTGEHLVLSNGVMNPVYPQRNFNPTEKTWGAFLLAARVEHFDGDPDWITDSAYVSVREADAYSLALNWILYPMVRLIGDYTLTELSDPIRTRVNPDGSVDYIERETLITVRFSIDF